MRSGQFAVFSGGWSLEASEKVCAPENPSDDVYELVDRLVGKSLVASEAPATSVRFRMLEVIREYALEKLDETNARFAVEQRHAAWYCEYAKECAVGLSQRRSAPWLGRVEAERQTCWRPSMAVGEHQPADGLAIIETLTEFSAAAGPVEQARVWLSVAWGHQAHPEKVEGGVAGRLMAALASVYIEARRGHLGTTVGGSGHRRFRGPRHGTRSRLGQVSPGPHLSSQRRMGPGRQARIRGTAPVPRIRRYPRHSHRPARTGRPGPFGAVTILGLRVYPARRGIGPLS